MECVMYSRFNELRRQKMVDEKRDISLREVAKATNLALDTIRRAASDDPAQVTSLRLTTVNALVKYFNLKSIDQLIEYRDE